MGLDSVELVMAVEKHFGISIPDGEASKLVTVGKLHAWVVNELQHLNRPTVEPSVVFDQLRELICDQLDISPERIVPESRFVQDLHID